jgi:ribosomal protein S8
MLYVNKLVYKNLVSLRNANRLKKMYVDCFYNSLMLKFLLFFYRKGYIFGYIFLTRFRVRVFLKYHNNIGLLTNLMFNVNRVNYSFKALMYLKTDSLLNIGLYKYVFLTEKGLLTLDEIFLYKYTIGGILYCYFI